MSYHDYRVEVQIDVRWKNSEGWMGLLEEGEVAGLELCIG